MSIETTSFAAGRHFDPTFSGTVIGSHTATEFNAALADAEIVEGETTGHVRHVFVRNFTDALAGVARITPENEHLLRTRYHARRDNELPVLTRWFPAGTVEVTRCEWFHLVLYTAEQCEVEGLPIQGEWGIVTVNSAVAPETSPLGPLAQMRNALGIEQGGNGNPLDDDEYARGVTYWSEWATVGGE
jgi:hypothetical protein